MSLKQKLLEAQHAKELAALKAENSQLQKELSVALERMVRRHGRVVQAAKVPLFKRSKGDFTRAICCDLHGAKMHRGAAGSFLEDMKRIRPKQIILLGDMVDVGGFLALHHVMGYVAETTYSYDDDIDATNKFLDALIAACPDAEIIYVEGNHENRVEKWACTQTLRHFRDAEGLRKRNAPEFLLKLAERNIRYIRMSQCYDSLEVPGTIRLGKCLFTHGSFVTSKHATAKIQSKFSGNVVFANTHRAQAEVVARVSTGPILAANPGCLCELNPVWRNTDPTDWTHGYALQFVSGGNGDFLHVNIPIIGGRSLMLPFLDTIAA